MLRSILVAVCLLIAGNALAQDAFIVRRDSQGRSQVESLGPDRYGSSVRRDSTGSYRGTATVTPYGDVILRDSRGRMEGIATQPSGRPPRR